MTYNDTQVLMKSALLLVIWSIKTIDTSNQLGLDPTRAYLRL